MDSGVVVGNKLYAVHSNLPDPTAKGWQVLCPGHFEQ